MSWTRKSWKRLKAPERSWHLCRFWRYRTPKCYWHWTSILATFSFDLNYCRKDLIQFQSQSGITSLRWKALDAYMIWRSVNFSPLFGAVLLHRQYFVGTHFTIRTDLDSLTGIRSLDDPKASRDGVYGYSISTVMSLVEPERNTKHPAHGRDYALTARRQLIQTTTYP